VTGFGQEPLGVLDVHKVQVFLNSLMKAFLGFLSNEGKFW
jgi:hypothetical protein